MRNLRLLLLAGFNITVPFKEAVIPYLNRLSPEARAIGAVNTVKKEGTRWVGHNTDHEGFLAGLKEAGFQPQGRSVVILGSGGSARAVAFALACRRVREVTLLNRTVTRAGRVARRFERIFPKTKWTHFGLEDPGRKRALSHAHLVVNATSVGLTRADPLLIASDSLPKRGALFYDLIYRPPLTRFLKLARRHGHTVVNGETMLLHQAARAFEIWTRRRPPLQVMGRALRDALCGE